MYIMCSSQYTFIDDGGGEDSGTDSGNSDDDGNKEYTQNTYKCLYCTVVFNL